MISFKQFLNEAVIDVKQIKPLPKPNDKEVWDRLREERPLTGWLFANGAVSFNPFAGHETNIRKFFALKQDKKIPLVGNHIEKHGIAVHIEDDGNVLEFRASEKAKPFAMKWAREMGIVDKRERIEWTQPLF